ncbi:nuclear transport factor 2 family protein [Dactylosporangium sp. CA-139066]|uniref:nuclear transport factor 2 family protein n=1 Tax=Dactylosporangium sp. CA-139066 TaxID=3239930 RepID=UPI003D9345E1
MDTADTAMRHWIAGAATGDWCALVALLAPAVEFHVPVSGFAGIQHGVEPAERFFAGLTARLRAELTVIARLDGDGRTAFEVNVAGLLSGRPFEQRLCLVFVIADGKVREFREYLAFPSAAL